MKRILTLIATVIIVMTANAETFSYRFSSTSLPKAIQKVMEDHPGLDINFIYNELENYKTSSTVHTDNAYNALRQLIGLNPVTVTKSGDSYYIEALQHGKYVYTGRVIGSGNEPVEAATVMLLAPKDSTVITYGITDNYKQQGDNSYINEASDDTRQGKLYADFRHSFGSKGTVSANLIALMYNSSTRYSGTSQMKDKAHTYIIISIVKR